MTSLTVYRTYKLDTHRGVLDPSALLFRRDVDDLPETFSPETSPLGPAYNRLLHPTYTGQGYIGIVYAPTRLQLYVRSHYRDYEYLTDCFSCNYRANYKCSGLVKEYPTNRLNGGRCFVHTDNDYMQDRHIEVEFPEFIQQFHFDEGVPMSYKLLTPGPATTDNANLLVTTLFTGNTYHLGIVCGGSVNGTMDHRRREFSPVPPLLRLLRGLHNRDLSLPYSGSLHLWFKDFRENAGFYGSIRHQLQHGYNSSVFYMPIGPYNLFVPEPGETLVAVHHLYRERATLPSAHFLVETTKRYFNVAEQQSFNLDELTLS